jgi:hypothetical protein
MPLTLAILTPYSLGSLHLRSRVLVSEVKDLIFLVSAWLRSHYYFFCLFSLYFDHDIIKRGKVEC